MAATASVQLRRSRSGLFPRPRRSPRPEKIVDDGNEPLDKLGVLDRLVELMGVARGAISLDQLDNLQSEVNGILKTTIKEVEKDGLEEPALMAFSIALDQTRHAISDRRSLLLAGTASA